MADSSEFICLRYFKCPLTLDSPAFSPAFTLTCNRLLLCEIIKIKAVSLILNGSYLWGGHWDDALTIQKDWPLNTQFQWNWSWLSASFQAKSIIDETRWRVGGFFFLSCQRVMSMSMWKTSMHPKKKIVSEISASFLPSDLIGREMQIHHWKERLTTHHLATTNNFRRLLPSGESPGKYNPAFTKIIKIGDTMSLIAS